MSLLFLSHSSADNAHALALQQWLIGQGWNQLFLDLDPERGIVAGERWERALYQAAHRCDAVLFLISRAWLASDWCRREFRLAQKLNKQIFGLLIDEIPIAELPGELRESWQLVDLAGGADHGAPREVTLPDGSKGFVTFSQGGLTRLRSGLTKAGLDPRFFPWPPASDPNRPPYRGLRPLEAEDAGIFFGREASIIELMAELRGLRQSAPPRFLAILGASGAGKSSFLRAGLLPRLAREDRHFLPLPVLRPLQAALTGERGLLSVLLEASGRQKLSFSRARLREAVDAGPEALLPVLVALAESARPPVLPGDEQSVAPTLVLSIDQAEELFQVEGRPEARRLLELLSTLLMAGEPGILVVVTIRSDSYEHLQSEPALDGVRQKTFSLPPLARGAYQQVIEGPANLLAASERPLSIEPRLTQQILDDLEAGGSKDSLPLLAFTLERLYVEYGIGDGDLLLSEYEQMGRIEGAISAAVARALDDARRDPKVPDDEEECLKLLRRGLIPWLAGIDPQTQKPRRRVARLSEIPAEAQSLIRHFIENRLLTTDRDEAGETTVEPAHESLLRQWHRLQGWLAEDAADLSTLDALQSAARDWEANARADAWLVHTLGRLEDAERLLLRDDLTRFVTPSDRNYLIDCRKTENARRNKELEDARALAASQQQVVRRTRVGLAAALILLLLASGLAYWTFERHSHAQALASKLRAAIFDAPKALDAISEKRYFDGPRDDVIDISCDPWPYELDLLPSEGARLYPDAKMKPEVALALSLFELPILDTSHTIRECVSTESEETWEACDGLLGEWDFGLAGFLRRTLDSCFEFPTIEHQSIEYAELKPPDLSVFKMNNAGFCGSGGCESPIFVVDNERRRIVAIEDAAYFVDLRVPTASVTERIAFVRHRASGAGNWRNRAIIYERSDARGEHASFVPIVTTESQTHNWAGDDAGE